MKKTLLVVTGTLLCVSCTTRPPLPLGEAPKVPTDDRPIVPVTFVFTTNALESTKFDNLQQMRKEIKILNKYYVDDKNNKIFKFKLNRYIPYTEFSKLRCDLKQQINQPYPISLKQFLPV